MADQVEHISRLDAVINQANSASSALPIKQATQAEANVKPNNNQASTTSLIKHTTLLEPNVKPNDNQTSSTFPVKQTMQVVRMGANVKPSNYQEEKTASQNNIVIKDPTDYTIHVNYIDKTTGQVVKDSNNQPVGYDIDANGFDRGPGQFKIDGQFKTIDNRYELDGDGSYQLDMSNIKKWGIHSLINRKGGNRYISTSNSSWTPLDDSKFHDELEGKINTFIADPDNNSFLDKLAGTADCTTPAMYGTYNGTNFDPTDADYFYTLLRGDNVRNDPNEWVYLSASNNNDPDGSQIGNIYWQYNDDEKTLDAMLNNKTVIQHFVNAGYDKEKDLSKFLTFARIFSPYLTNDNRIDATINWQVISHSTFTSNASSIASVNGNTITLKVKHKTQQVNAGSAILARDANLTVHAINSDQSDTKQTINFHSTGLLDLVTNSIVSDGDWQASIKNFKASNLNNLTGYNQLNSSLKYLVL